MIALHGTAQHVEKMVRQFRRCLEAQELSRAVAQQQGRCVAYHWDDDGSLVLKARLPAETGAIVLKALQMAVKDIPARLDMTEHYARTGLDGRFRGNVCG